MADVEFDHIEEDEGGQRLSLLNWVGALISISLLAGLAVWGYKLAVRDVTGVPVVRALEGPMRIQPENPGGRQASYQGLAVNNVQSDGQAEPTADTLILAPAPIDLIAADQPIQATRPASVTVEEQPDEETAVLASAQVSPSEVTDVDALANQVAASVTTELAQDAAAEEGDTVEIIAASVPGVSKSPRPKPRPEGDFVARAAAAAETVSAPAGETQEVDASSIPAGTRLVQLGAFDTPDMAREEWARLVGGFGDYFEGKSRVVQEATSGGRTFYRLRAMGFDDLSDARRFCSVLLVKDAACIPVEVR
ncbi:SPOR domain-containing protein [Aliiroseovarius sp. YM-037]|uniref:SPOR domain-containing protein n=1 Tax=Aliiroseovarius sp. YM-037 TaxID=3341728 RepID=UPI003A80A67F